MYTKPGPHRYRLITLLSGILFVLLVFTILIFIHFALRFDEYYKNNWPVQWIYLLLLLLFIVLSVLLCCVFKKSNLGEIATENERRGKEFYTISPYAQENSGVVVNERRICIGNLNSIGEAKNECRNSISLDDMRLEINEKFSPRCSVEREVDKNLVEDGAVDDASPLTPREKFFNELLNDANKSRSSTVYNVNCCNSFEGTVSSPDANANKTTQYFFASAPVVNKTNIFMYINAHVSDDQ